MTDDDLSLVDTPVTIRGPLNIKVLSDMYSNCLVRNNPSLKSTRVESLIDSNNRSVTLPCPRDDINSYVIIDNNVYQGWDCCNYCLYQLDCHIFGVTKKFILAEKHEEEQE